LRRGCFDALQQSTLELRVRFSFAGFLLYLNLFGNLGDDSPINHRHQVLTYPLIKSGLLSLMPIILALYNDHHRRLRCTLSKRLKPNPLHRPYIHIPLVFLLPAQSDF